ncbi:MAG: hypothetical protein SFY81_05240 [Verrucomicrobiota bacterium]|nr:hypothetical protein [Verrucomicrobiota bacterium]
MQLKDLIESIKPVAVRGSVQREITGITTDPRQVRAGGLFFALGDLKQGNHTMAIENAIRRGAIGIVAENEEAVPYKATNIQVTSSRKAWLEATRAFYGNPAERLSKIAIQGEESETTPVAWYLKELLSLAGEKAGWYGHSRCDFGTRTVPLIKDESRLLKCDQYYAQMLHEGCKAVVVEASSRDFLDSDQFDYIFNTTEGLSDFAVVQMGDETAVHAGPTCYVLAEKIRYFRDHTHCTLISSDIISTVALPFSGRSNLLSFLKACTALLKTGMMLNPGVLKHIIPCPGLREHFQAPGCPSVYVDGAKGAGLIQLLLKELGELHPKRIVMVGGATGEMTAQERRDLGTVAAGLTDFCYLTSDNPGQHSPSRIAAEVAQGFGSKFHGYKIVPDRKQAIAEAIAKGGPEDIVVVTGKGIQAVQMMEDSVIPFDDRQVVREQLETNSKRQEMTVTS